MSTRTIVNSTSTSRPSWPNNRTPTTTYYGRRGGKPRYRGRGRGQQHSTSSTSPSVAAWALPAGGGGAGSSMNTTAARRGRGGARVTNRGRGGVSTRGRGSASMSTSPGVVPSTSMITSPTGSTTDKPSTRGRGRGGGSATSPDVPVTTYRVSLMNMTPRRRGRGGRGGGRVGRGTKAKLNASLDHVDDDGTTTAPSTTHTDDEDPCFNEIGHHKHDDDDFLNDIFGVVDPSTLKSNPCLNIPKARPIQWLPEYNDLDPNLILITGYELECLTEKIEALKVFEPYKIYCPCGNVANTENDNSPAVMDDDIEMNYGISSVPSKSRSSNSTHHLGHRSSSCELESPGVGVLDGGFLMDENDPFFDDGSDDWIVGEDNFPTNNFSTSVDPVKSPPANETLLTKTKFTFKMKSRSELNETSMDQPTCSISSSSVVKIPAPPTPKKDSTVKTSPLANTTHSEGSTTSFEEDVDVDNPAWKQEQQANQKSVETKEPTEAIGPPREISPQSPSYKSSPAPFVISICDDEDNSSTTSNDEEFPFWKRKLESSQSVTTTSKPINPTQSQSQQQSQASHKIDRDVKETMFQDDMLLFEDDEEDFVPAPLVQNSNNFKSRTPPPPPPPEESAKNPPLMFGGSKTSNFTTNTAVQCQKSSATLYNATETGLFSPLRSIFSSGRKMNDTSFAAASTATPLPSQPQTVTSIEENNPQRLPGPSSLLNTNSDDEIMELERITGIEQQPNKSRELSSSNPSGCNKSIEIKSSLPSNRIQSYLSKSRPPTAPTPTIRNNFESPPPRRKLALTQNKPSTSTSHSTKKNYYKDWIDVNSRPPPRPSGVSKASVKPQSQTFKRPNMPQPKKHVEQPLEFSDDDDFIMPPLNKNASRRNVIPSPSASSSSSTQRGQSSLNATSSPKSNGASSSRRDLNSSFHGISPISSKRRKKKKRRKVEGVNQFLELEADVSDDDSSSSGDGEEDEFDGLDEYDASFVDTENDHGVTDSQQVRYLKSVRSPISAGRRVEQPLQPRLNNSSVVLEDPDYESDSFCVANDDDVEFADVGVFTQAMDVARQEIMKEGASSTKRRRTRRQARETGPSYKVNLNKKPSTTTSKGRRRIIINDSSDDE